MKVYFVHRKIKDGDGLHTPGTVANGTLFASPVDADELKENLKKRDRVLKEAGFGGPEYTYKLGGATLPN